MSSPRSWGCFQLTLTRHAPAKVFPTLVGVFLLSFYTAGPKWRLPHARGGVSDKQRHAQQIPASSPRSWGCFHGRFGRKSGKSVFPTLVGVFLSVKGVSGRGPRLPHARGGVSGRYLVPHFPLKSSPRSWGCFRTMQNSSAVNEVFPTLVGVFLSDNFANHLVPGLPHARGGVSIEERAMTRQFRSSPRSWGCFLQWSRLSRL